MRRVIALLSVFACLIWAGMVWGQARTGSLYGTVSDADGNPLPGVTVTLSSAVTANLVAVSDVDGTYRFPSIPPSTYSLKFELDGFKTVVRDNIEVRVGSNSKVDVSMAPGGGEEVVVSGAVPVVDVKKTELGANLTRRDLQDIPTARDPWVILELAPGVLVDRENVGGSESGQQSIYTSRGDSGDNSQWNVDGVNITDPAAIGASPTYYDFDAFEEMQIATGANDVEAPTGGVIINFVTRRGGNKLMGGGRFYWTSDDLQSDNSKDKADELFTPGSKGNPINDIKDFGANIGGPVIKDKLWFWGAYGGQRIDIQAVTGQPDKTNLDNITAKLNAQVGKHMLEGFFMWGNKTKNGRGAAATRPPETTWDQSGPSPIFKAQDELFVSDNLFLSLKAGLVLGGFKLEPKGGRNVPVTLDYGTGVWGGSYYWYETERPQLQFTGTAIYYKSDWLGGDHEIKLGAEFRRSGITSQSNFGNGMVIAYYPAAWEAGAGEVWLIRNSHNDDTVQRISAFLQDTFTTGRLTLLLGLRFDNQRSGYNDVTVPAQDLLGDLSANWLPGGSSGSAGGLVNWNNFSPRVGFTYDITGDAKTLLKGNFALYPSTLGINEVYYMQNTTWKELDFWWMEDTNGDGVPQADEVYWDFPIYWNHEPGDPNRVVNAIADDLGSPQTLEVVIGVEREIIEDLGVGLNAIYRRNYNFTRGFPYDIDGNVTTEDIYNCWAQEGTIPAEFGGWPYYACSVPKPSGVLYENNPDLNNDYKGLELRFTKRMSKNWMLQGSFTVQDWKRHYDSRQAYVDPTNVEQLNDQPMAYESRGSGKSAIWPNARWSAKFGGVVRLPLDFNFGASFVAREGYIFPVVYRTLRTSNGWGRNVDVYTVPFGDERLPTFWMLNLRLEKLFNFGDYGRLYLTVDGFNITNNDIELGLFNRADNTAKFRKITELVAPRVFRIGARYEF